MNFSREQVNAMAPDAASLTAGKKIASSTWASFGASERALWGEFAGSGKNPYQVEVDLRNMGFKCSCPSRKIPCKHVLGLLLTALDSNPKQDGPEPQWVSDWLDKRDERAEKKKAKEAKEAGEAEEDKPKKTVKKAPKTPSKSSEKNAAKREARVAEGVEQLKTWLSDLIRVGLGSLDPKSKVWDEEAKRLVDAQAPGLAGIVSSIGEFAAAFPNEREALLGKMGRLALLVEACGKIDKAPEDFASELRQTIGWTVSQADVLESGERVDDQWLCVGRRIVQTGKIKALRTWFRGAKSKRWALYLQFAAGRGASFAEHYPEGFARRETAARFYPGVVKLRALWEANETIDQPMEKAELPSDAVSTMPELFKNYAASLAKFPWQEQFPVVLKGIAVRPAPGSDKDDWSAIDGEGRVLPLALEDPEISGATFAVVSASRPVDLFGEWNGRTFAPLSAWVDGKLVFPQLS
ncbi:MAG: SWIM zinc finger family protein [Thermoguttaceae bacterium]|nr:SWIM zinc finger family protein [Thermoguttaceae bacterium]